MLGLITTFACSLLIQSSNIEYQKACNHAFRATLIQTKLSQDIENIENYGKKKVEKMAKRVNNITARAITGVYIYTIQKEIILNVGYIPFDGAASIHWKEKYNTTSIQLSWTF